MEGGGGRGGLGEGGRFRGEPPAEMQHIRKELQNCTTQNHSAFSFVVMSEDGQCNSSFWVHTLCPHLNTSMQHKQETRRSACSWQLCCPGCAHDGPHEQELMRQAAHLAVLSRRYGGLCYQLAQSCHWSVQKKCGTSLCSIVCLLPGDRGAKERTDGTLRHEICNRGKK